MQTYYYDLSFMNLVHHTRSTLVLASALLAASLVAAQPASAEMDPTVKAESAQTGLYLFEQSPNGDVRGCATIAEKPFFITMNSRKMHGAGKVTKCTNPPPDKCKMTVDLEAKEPSAFLWHTVQTGERDWGKCKKFTTTTEPFTCHASPEKFEFRTFVIFQIEVFGQFARTPHSSGIEKFFCQG
ncbi:MAG TPA: hypothetical protein VFI65_02525 [Streptosporangiaceae bacterium]|nr:hypothetical protein [Streptosporangiaceae bacterium]